MNYKQGVIFPLIIGSLLSVSSLPASANVIVLDFEGVGDLASVGDYYNGGVDSQGNSGENFGVSFSSASLAIKDGDTKGIPLNGNFANEPSPDTVLFFLQGNTATLTFDAGFTTGFSFFYTTQFDTGFVNVYDDIDGTGNLLATLNLSLNWKDNGCTGDPTGDFCNWDPIGVAFDGIARSVDFGGTLNQVGFDDITFGSATPGRPRATVVPSPGTLSLFSVGLIGLAGFARKQRQPAQGSPLA
ncbi:hypothetical protein [Pelagibius sp. Alg239-R121]|uniref:hypothetical protein n=1 Tax=Pelagibius sp. Alg239-R121 TaxID=2993448 RepID=UPI0024A75CE2|nr:hypothetical protein [Pelagibius sp. Alg239-R121]